MHSALNPTAIALSVSIGASLVAVLISMFVAMGSRGGGGRDAAVPVLSGIAVLLIVVAGIAAVLIGAGGMDYLGVLKAALLLIAAFAVICTAFGLVRGSRSGRAIGT